MTVQQSRKVQAANEPNSDAKDKLILIVSDPPSPADIKAKEEVFAFDSTVQIVSLPCGQKPATPRLDAIEVDKSLYNGLTSILSFIEGEKRKSRAV